jgi:hypothetical protein|tara:strand:+ start:430 stop:669 length:240 start_codon:yes stop_codon:yes gene_type:complete
MVGQRKENLEKGFQSSWKEDWVGHKGIKADLISLLNLIAIVILLPIIIPAFMFLLIEATIILRKEKQKYKDVLSRGHKE